MTDDTWGFDTRQIHAGQTPDSDDRRPGGADLPDHQLQFRDSAHAANLFGLAEVGNIYTRIMNPTQAVLEARVAALEGAPDTALGIPGALATSSGSGRRDAGHPQPGRGRRSHRVVDVALRRHLQPAALHAAEVRHRGHASSTTPTTSTSGVRRSRPNTKAFFAESIGNPRNDFLDIEGVAGVAHDNDVPLIVDNTVATPWLIRPFEWGADIVVHSATKFIGGHGTSIGGIIVDGGTFDFGASGRFPGFTEPDPSYHGLAVLGGSRAPGRSSQGPRAAAARPRGRRSARSTRSCSCRASRRSACGWSATTPTRSRVVDFLAAHPQVRVDRLRRPSRLAVARAGPPLRPRAGVRLGAGVHHRGRQGGGPAVRRGADPAQPRGQHRRRAQPRHPPGHRPPTASSATRNSCRPESTPGWCACRWASSRSTTSSPTSTRASPPPRSDTPGCASRTRRGASHP